MNHPFAYAAVSVPPKNPFTLFTNLSQSHFYGCLPLNTTGIRSDADNIAAAVGLSSYPYSNNVDNHMHPVQFQNFCNNVKSEKESEDFFNKKFDIDIFQTRKCSQKFKTSHPFAKNVLLDKVSDFDKSRDYDYMQWNARHNEAFEEKKCSNDNVNRKLHALQEREKYLHVDANHLLSSNEFIQQNIKRRYLSDEDGYNIWHGKDKLKNDSYHSSEKKILNYAEESSREDRFCEASLEHFYSSERSNDKVPSSALVSRYRDEGCNIRNRSSSRIKVCGDRHRSRSRSKVHVRANHHRSRSRSRVKVPYSPSRLRWSQSKFRVDLHTNQQHSESRSGVEVLSKQLDSRSTSRNKISNSPSCGNRHHSAGKSKDGEFFSSQERKVCFSGKRYRDKVTVSTDEIRCRSHSNPKFIEDTKYEEFKSERLNKVFSPFYSFEDDDIAWLSNNNDFVTSDSILENCGPIYDRHATSFPKNIENNNCCTGFRERICNDLLSNFKYRTNQDNNDLWTHRLGSFPVPQDLLKLEEQQTLLHRTSDIVNDKEAPGFWKEHKIQLRKLPLNIRFETVIRTLVCELCGSDCRNLAQSVIHYNSRYHQRMLRCVGKHMGEIHISPNFDIRDFVKELQNMQRACGRKIARLLELRGLENHKFVCSEDILKSLRTLYCSNCRLSFTFTSDLIRHITTKGHQQESWLPEQISWLKEKDIEVFDSLIWPSVKEGWKAKGVLPENKPANAFKIDVSDEIIKKENLDKHMISLMCSFGLTECCACLTTLDSPKLTKLHYASESHFVRVNALKIEKRKDQHKDLCKQYDLSENDVQNIWHVVDGMSLPADDEEQLLKYGLTQCRLCDVNFENSEAAIVHYHSQKHLEHATHNPLLSSLEHPPLKHETVVSANLTRRLAPGPISIYPADITLPNDLTEYINEVVVTQLCTVCGNRAVSGNHSNVLEHVRGSNHRKKLRAISLYQVSDDHPSKETALANVTAARNHLDVLSLKNNGSSLLKSTPLAQ